MELQLYTTKSNQAIITGKPFLYGKKKMNKINCCVVFRKHNSSKTKQPKYLIDTFQVLMHNTQQGH